MSEMMDVLNAFGSQLKLAWVGWLAWGVGPVSYTHLTLPTIYSV